MKLGLQGEGFVRNLWKQSVKIWRVNEIKKVNIKMKRRVNI